MTPSLLLLALACTDKADDSDPVDSEPATSRYSRGDAPAGAVLAVNSCAPTDAAATELRFGLSDWACSAEYAAGSLTLSINGREDLAPGEHAIWGADYDPEGDGDPLYSSEGSVTFTRFEDRGMTGSWTLTIDGETLSGDFDGLTCGGETNCG